MDNPGEILRLCRLCLVKDQVNIPIFAEQGDSREIFLKISSCLPVKVSIEDRLPKKICDGCSEKLNSFYEFWSSSANAEKTLLSWLGEDEVEEKKVQAVPKSLTASATLVKEESAELVDEAHAESIEESTKDESEAPPTKRARRSAAVKAQINLAPDSEDDDLDTTEPLTKMEEESADSDGEEKDPSYTEMPGTSADDEQAGPSGMGKDGVEAPTKQSSNPIKPKFECDICGLHLKTKGSLNVHKKRHLKQYVAKCEECQMGFVTNQEYSNHMGFKHGPGNHICNICGRSCYDKAALQGHMARHAEDYGSDTTIKCHICEKTFLQTKYLKHHMWRKHENGGQSYVCHLCGKKVNSKRSLRDHTYIHQGIKPLECTECGKSFGLRTTLKLHMRTHTGQRPYECTFCSKRFTQRTPLKVHMRYHTGERPYGCHLCEERFVSGGLLNAHIRKMHGTNI